MYRIFCHINEMADDAWDALPAMLLLADEVVLWSPWAGQLHKLHEEGKSPIGTTDLLALVDSGAVKIAAREPWIESKEFRNRPDRWSNWFSPFDDHVRAMWKEDSNDRRTDARVIIAPTEQGYEWADRQLDEETDAVKIAKKILSEDRIPKGTRDRISRLNFDQQSKIDHRYVREVLRDARNHEDAKNFVGAELAAQASPFPVLEFNQISGAPGQHQNQMIVDRSDVRELFSWIGGLKYAGDVKSLLLLREDRSYRDQIWQLMTAGKHPLAALKERIAMGIPDRSFFTETYGSTPLKAAGVGGAATAAIGAKMTRRWFCLSGAVTATGVGFAAFPPAYTLAKQKSLIPDESYTGDVWPFLLFSGSLTPRRDEAIALVKEITQVLRT